MLIENDVQSVLKAFQLVLSKSHESIDDATVELSDSNHDRVCECLQAISPPVDQTIDKEYDDEYRSEQHKQIHTRLPNTSNNSTTATPNNRFVGYQHDTSATRKTAYSAILKAVFAESYRNGGLRLYL